MSGEYDLFQERFGWASGHRHRYHLVFFVVKPALNEAAAASHGVVGWDVSSAAEAYHLLAICLLTFMAGFIWELDEHADGSPHSFVLLVTRAPSSVTCVTYGAPVGW